MKIEIATIATTGTTIANTGIITPGMIASNVHTGTGWKNDAKNIANLRKRISNSKRNTGDGAIDIPATDGNAVRVNFQQPEHRREESGEEYPDHNGFAVGEFSTVSITDSPFQSYRAR